MSLSLLLSFSLSFSNFVDVGQASASTLAALGIASESKRRLLNPLGISDEAVAALRMEIASASKRRLLWSVIFLSDPHAIIHLVRVKG